METRLRQQARQQHYNYNGTQPITVGQANANKQPVPHITLLESAFSS